MMATIEIRGGDFMKGTGAFHAREGFTLRNESGQVETIPVRQLTMADHASEFSLPIYGARAPLQQDFAGASQSVPLGHRLFIARFADARLLLASADQTTFEQICTPRA